MSYVKTTWVNDSTPLNADNMNNIENGIESAWSQIAKSILYASGTNYNCNELYDGKMYPVVSGTNCPSGNAYGVLLTLPYRQLTGNTKPDFGAQIYLPNGDDNTSPNSLFYRTGLANDWNPWQEVLTASKIPLIKSTGKYIEDGTLKYSSGAAAQTGTTVSQDGGWVQPVADGRGSAAFGRGTVAGGQEDWNNPDSANHDYAFACGKNAKAYGDSSFAANRGTKVTGANAAAFNESTEAQGKDSFAIGYGSKAYSKGAFASGYYTEATGEYSFTANSSDTNGKYAFAAGEETRANAEAATTFGRSTVANGSYSVAMGHSSTTNHTSSCAIGENTITGRAAQTVVGQNNITDGDALFVVGDGSTSSSRSNCFATGSNGSGKYIDLGNSRIYDYQLRTINGMSGGVLTSQLIITGGDASSSAKIAVSNSGSGQITDEGTHTLFGFTDSNTNRLTVGHSNYYLNLRGTGTRPLFNGNEMALLSDFNTFLQNMPGYDPSKTQVLKSINGSFTWVDET